MMTKVEMGSGVFALACFVGAVDSWFGIGALDLLVDLLLSEPDATQSLEAVPGMSNSEGHGTHASLFLSAGLVALGLGLSSSEIAPILRDRTLSRPEGRAKRRLVVSIVYVARACDGAMPRDVAEAFYSVTGEPLDRGEIAKAIAYLRSEKGASLERILGKIVDEQEKRRIVNGTSRIWFRHGLDSERATRALERVSSAMGLEDSDISAALDPTWTAEASRVLKNVETWARRTVSRATTEAQRITTRLRGMG